MNKAQSFYAKCLIYPLALTLLLPMSAPKAELNKIDPYEFCANSCTSPGPCEKATIADDCKKLCGEGNVWKHVASLYMNKTSKEYRTEKDVKVKDTMLLKSPIAKCLGFKVPEERPIQKPAGLPSSTKEEICAAAIKKELADLGHDQSTLRTQEETLTAVLRALQPTPVGAAAG